MNESSHPGRGKEILIHVETVENLEVKQIFCSEAFLVRGHVSPFFGVVCLFKTVNIDLAR